MDKLNRNVILFGLGVVTAYDLFTTITGSMEILGRGMGSIIASVTLGVIIAGMLYYTYEIQHISHKEFIPLLIKPIWFLSFLYDIYTSFTGNNRFIVNSDIKFGQIVKGNIGFQSISSNIGELIILVGLTFFVSSCPIILSYVRNEPSFMRGEHV